MINFKKVRYKNLLSSGNTFTEIQLDTHQTTLILGENGSGKSTLLDALCFGLYGRGFRNLKKDLLINSINGRDLLVEIEFSIGTKQYKVIRGAKPNRFEMYLDDVLVNQDANVRDYQEHLEKQILKMSFRSFTQVAILGSANFVPFMQLKSKDRRNLVEDLLDISIFSTMQEVLRNKMSAHKNEITETGHDIKIMEERIHGLNEQLNVLRENRDSKISKYESTVEETQSNINNLMEKIDEKTQDVVAETTSIKDKDSKENQLTELLDLERQLEGARKKTIREIKFYDDNDNCPTCEQGIDEDHKKKHVTEKELKKTELVTALVEIEGKVGNCSNRLAEIREVQGRIEEVQKNIALLQTEVVSNQKYITKLQKEIEDLKTEATAGSDAEDKILDAEDTLDILIQKKEKQSETSHYYDIAQMLLRDQGVKQKIIKQYVPIMNKLINKYLAQLEFYVGFEIDESFEETIKSRFRDVFKYDNFSQGEKMRIDLSLLFTWRAIARMKNSVNTNLLILDEVFDSSLDTAGTDDFLKLLNTLTERTNAFIISHKGDALHDKFNQVLRFEKYKNFSRVAE
jgi:DNA repair exonuclease SbcCD ATPase subunit